MKFDERKGQPNKTKSTTTPHPNLELLNKLVHILNQQSPQNDFFKHSSTGKCHSTHRSFLVELASGETSALAQRKEKMTSALLRKLVQQITESNPMDRGKDKILVIITPKTIQSNKK